MPSTVPVSNTVSKLDYCTKAKSFERNEEALNDANLVKSFSSNISTNSLPSASPRSNIKKISASVLIDQLEYEPNEQVRVNNSSSCCRCGPCCCAKAENCAQRVAKADGLISLFGLLIAYIVYEIDIRFELTFWTETVACLSAVGIITDIWLSASHLLNVLSPTVIWIICTLIRCFCLIINFVVSFGRASSGFGVIILSVLSWSLFLLLAWFTTVMIAYAMFIQRSKRELVLSQHKLASNTSLGMNPLFRPESVHGQTVRDWSKKESIHTSYKHVEDHLVNQIITSSAAAHGKKNRKGSHHHHHHHHKKMSHISS